MLEYLDEDGAAVPLTSTDVNSSVRDAAEMDVTAKDFRTWTGTLLATTALAALSTPESERACQHATTEVVREVRTRNSGTLRPFTRQLRASCSHRMVRRRLASRPIGTHVSAQGSRFLRPEERKLVHVLHAGNRRRRGP